MSIADELQKLVDSHVLVFWPPTIVSNSAHRDVFVSQEVKELLNAGPTITADLHKAAGRSRAKVESFASGKTIVFAFDPFVKSPASLVSRNAPVLKGIVELRPTAHSPDIRMFGGFAVCDALVLLTWARKTNLHYATEIKKCRQVWDALFPLHKPLVGSSHDQYVSSNCLPG
jgi:hypothetical protein